MTTGAVSTASDSSQTRSGFSPGARAAVRPAAISTGQAGARPPETGKYPIRYIFDFLQVVAYLFGLTLDVCHYSSYGFVDTALDVHRVGAGRYILEAHVYYGLCEYGGCGRTVAGVITGL